MIRQAGYNTVITVPDGDAASYVLPGGDAAVIVRKADSELLARIRKEPAFGAVQARPRHLQRDGIAVRTAATGEEAIRVAAAEPPALDVGFPEHDGFEEQRGRLRLGPTRFLTKSKTTEDFPRLVVELRQIPLPRSADSVTRS